MSGAPTWPKDDAERIRRALATEGGHLGIGLNGYTLYYARGSTLSGYDVARMKADCLAAGLPVIDSRRLGLDLAVTLAFSSPLVAVGTPPDAEPWHPLASAPLAYVAALYRAAGAEVSNLPAP